MVCTQLLPRSEPAPSLLSEGQVRALYAHGKRMRNAIDLQSALFAVAEAARAFEPFFTTRASGGQTALVLSVCGHTLTRHRGTVTLHSALGISATAMVRLPLVPGGAVSA
jgi:hypothetical protein